jgi:hypothetical protein
MEVTSMLESVFELKGYKSPLTARGPEDKLEAALSAVEAIVFGADHLPCVAGLVEAHDCFVRITNEKMEPPV